MNCTKKTFVVLFAFSVVLMMSGCMSTRPTIVDAKTGKVKASMQTALTYKGCVVSADSESRRFHTVLRSGDNLVLRTYSESFRKVAESKVRGPRGFAGYAVRGDEVAFLDSKTQDIRIYDIAAKTEKTIAVSDIRPCKNCGDAHMSPRTFMWISNSKLLLADYKKAYVVDVVSQKCRTIYNDNGNIHIDEIFPSPDGRRFALTDGVTGKPSGAIKILNVEGKLIKTIGTKNEIPRLLSWSPASKELAYLTNSRRIKIYNMDSGKERVLSTVSSEWKCHRLNFEKDVLILYFDDSENATGFTDKSSLVFIDSQTGEKSKAIRGISFCESFFPLDGDGKYITDAAHYDDDSRVYNFCKIIAWILTMPFHDGEF